MDLKQLEYFVRVAELGSFTRAAQACRIQCDYVPRRSWPLFKARAVLAGLLASDNLEHKP